MNAYKKDDIVNYKGVKGIVTSVNSNGTVTIHAAAGSGKTGYLGTIPKFKSQYSRTAFVNLTEPKAILEEGVITLDDYNNSVVAEEEAVLNGYSRGRSDMAQKMRMIAKKKLSEDSENSHLSWIVDRLQEVEESEYVTSKGEVSEYKTVNITEGTMKPYNMGHGIGIRDLRTQISSMLEEYTKENPESKASAEWFISATSAEKKREPETKRKPDSDKTPQDYLRLARYMYMQTIQNPGETRRLYGYKSYISKVMRYYDISEPEAHELVRGNLDNRGQDPEPKIV